MKNDPLKRIHKLYETGIIDLEEFHALLGIHRIAGYIESEAQKHYKHRQMTWCDYVQLGVITSSR